MKWNLSFTSFLKRAAVFIGLLLLVITVQIPIEIIAKYNYRGLSAFCLSVLYLVLFVGFILIARYCYSKVFQQKSHKMNLKDLEIILGAFLMFLIVEIILDKVNQFGFHQTGTANNNMIYTLMRSNPYVLGLMSFSAVFLSPILEELVFRGYFMHAFFKPNSLWLPIIISGLLFSCGHMSTDIVSFMIYAILGMILAYVYKKTNKIECSIGLHFLNNLLATGAMLITILMG